MPLVLHTALCHSAIFPLAAGRWILADFFAVTRRLPFGRALALAFAAGSSVV